MGERRQYRADFLLRQNVSTLLHARRLDQSALALWCGHRPAWISKILSGERGVQLDDLGKIADFFGLTVAELFQQGISPLTERRVRHRRTQADRRGESDRRQPRQAGSLHPDVQVRFSQDRRTG